MIRSMTATISMASLFQYANGVLAASLAGGQTKRVDGGDLPKSHFAYQGSGGPSSWHLPIKFSTDEKTKSHIRDALSRWDQTDMPDSTEKAKAWRRIVSAAKAHGIEVNEKHTSFASFVEFAGPNGAKLMDTMELHNYLKPTDADYIQVPIRALSATAVQGGIMDFGHKDGKALREAVPLFNNLTIFKDHDWSVDNWLGKTSDAYWDGADGDTPAGVNMMLNVDTKADPKAARGLLSGALDSGSVTVKFDYEQSHPKMKLDEFFNKLGEEVDGETVRALVTKITRLMEYSVVWQGADAYAKVIGDDGKIYVPGQASNSLKHKTGKQENTMDWSKLAALLGLNLGESVTQETFEAAVKAQNINATALAEAQVKVTEAQTALTVAQTELSASKTQVTELTASVTKLTTDLATSTTQATTLQNKVTELTPMADLGRTSLTEVRTEALRLYNLVEADKATEAMRALINGAELSVARSFVTSYKDRAEQVAPLKCTACGSSSLSRGVAVPADVPAVDTGASTLQNDRMKAALASVHGK